VQPGGDQTNEPAGRPAAAAAAFDDAPSRVAWHAGPGVARPTLLYSLRPLSFVRLPVPGHATPGQSQHMPADADADARTTATTNSQLLQPAA
jgi:hypothetical protein